MKPFVFSVYSVEQIEGHIQSAQQDGLTPTLAIVFSSVAHNLTEVGAAFAKFNIEVFGASTSGEIINDEVYEGSIAVMLLDISRDAYRLSVFDGKGKTSYQAGQSVAEWAETVYDDSAFMVMSAGLRADGEQIVHGIVDTMGRQVALFGGLAGDDLKMQETFVFSASEVVANGVMALIFDRHAIDLQGIAASGWKGIGTPKTITKAEGNIVYRIDDKPALGMYNKYLDIGDDPMRAAEYPLLLIRDDGSVVLRTAFVVNEDNSIVYSGTVPEGAKVRFSMPPGSEIIDHAIEQMTEFSKQNPRSDAIVLFSCKARHLALGPMVEDEISGIRKLWKVALIGSFTYGEIGPGPEGRPDFHNHTLVPVMIQEK
ncbi:MAG: FIST N-terminal domain-containing protein [Desulfobacterales bacterium]